MAAKMSSQLMRPLLNNGKNGKFVFKRKKIRTINRINCIWTSPSSCHFNPIIIVIMFCLLWMIFQRFITLSSCWLLPFQLLLFVCYCCRCRSCCVMLFLFSFICLVMGLSQCGLQNKNCIKSGSRSEKGWKARIKRIRGPLNLSNLYILKKTFLHFKHFSVIMLTWLSG